jgi:hypothetical protein
MKWATGRILQQIARYKEEEWHVKTIYPMYQWIEHVLIKRMSEHHKNNAYGLHIVYQIVFVHAFEFDNYFSNTVIVLPF